MIYDHIENFSLKQASALIRGSGPPGSATDLIPCSRHNDDILATTRSRKTAAIAFSCQNDAGVRKNTISDKILSRPRLRI